MTAGNLVAITGPAAVGKSTLVKALQRQLTRSADLWLALELDVFARGLPRSWISWGEHEGRYADRGFAYRRTREGSIELILGNDGRRVLGCFRRSVAAVVRSGVNVICETIVYDDDDWNDWVDALGEIPACWVRLTAPVSILEARENAERPGSARGLARGMAARDPVGAYHIEIDTADEATDTSVQRILASLPW